MSWSYVHFPAKLGSSGVVNFPSPSFTTEVLATQARYDNGICDKNKLTSSLRTTVLGLPSFPTFRQLGFHFWVSLRMGSNEREGTGAGKILGAELSAEAEWTGQVMQLDTAGHSWIQAGAVST